MFHSGLFWKSSAIFSDIKIIRLGQFTERTLTQVNTLILKVKLFGITKSAGFKVLLQEQITADLLPMEIHNIKKFAS